MDSGGGELDVREAKELAWALAAIWKDPPSGTSAEVGQFLIERGLAEFVTAYLEKLN